LTLGTAMVAGCDNSYVMQLKDEFGWTEARMLNVGCLKTYPIAQPPIYCYNTLGHADCFLKPKREHKDRLTSSSYEGYI
jgi:hypothetical protein